MDNLQSIYKNYLDFCQYQKRLDSKTLKAYRIDLNQFQAANSMQDISTINSEILENYIASLHKKYKPKTVKRKIASLKAFFHYLDYKELINQNPFNRMQIKFREPTILPKTIPLQTVETFLSTIYSYHTTATTNYQRKNSLRDIAVIELLFATGIRISELCSLKSLNVNLYEQTILIYGKGSKERKIQIGNDDVITILKEYKETFKAEIQNCNFFFVTQSSKPLSDQSVRRMINKYASLAAIELHITPPHVSSHICH